MGFVSNWADLLPLTISALFNGDEPLHNVVDTNRRMMDVVVSELERMVSLKAPDGWQNFGAQIYLWQTAEDQVQRVWNRAASWMLMERST